MFYHYYIATKEYRLLSCKSRELQLCCCTTAAAIHLRDPANLTAHLKNGKLTYRARRLRCCGLSVLAVIPGPTDELLLNLACLALSTRWSTSWLMLGVLMTLPYRLAATRESSSPEGMTPFFAYGREESEPE